MNQGRPSPEAMMHFPLCFRFPPVSKKFSDSTENFPNFTFSRKYFLIFISQNFWWLFLVNHKFRISPLFSLFQYISPLFQQNYSFPPTLTISPLFSANLRVFYIPCVFRFPPYFYHLCITQCTYWTPLYWTVILGGPRENLETTFACKVVKNRQDSPSFTFLSSVFDLGILPILSALTDNLL